jgi:hypothetical protein
MAMVGIVLAPIPVIVMVALIVIVIVIVAMIVVMVMVMVMNMVRALLDDCVAVFHDPSEAAARPIPYLFRY